DAASEIAHRGLMMIFAQQGQRDRALRQFAMCVDALAGELGVSPSQETRALRERIERQRETTDVPRERAPLHTPMRIPPLVARESECQVIDACLDQLSFQRGSVLLIEGAAGIGKTRLVWELVARAQRRGFKALVGSAYEAERTVAYGPFVEILQAGL